jgi:hypothetical protein
VTNGRIIQNTTFCHSERSEELLRIFCATINETGVQLGCQHQLDEICFYKDDEEFGIYLLG